MKVLLDTNVVLDALFDREPFADAATRLLAAVETRQVNGWIGATTVTTIDDLATKHLGRRHSRDAIRDLLELRGRADRR